MKTQFKTYTEEQVKNLFKGYDLTNVTVDQSNKVHFFKFEDSSVYGECELISEDDVFYWAISYDSKHNFQGGINRYLTLEDCLKFVNRM